MNGKQISDDEFFHTANVSFALVTDSVKTTQSQMLSLCPERENGRQLTNNFCSLSLLTFLLPKLLLGFILILPLAILEKAESRKPAVQLSKI